jgi:hypothetical protein
VAEKVLIELSCIFLPDFSRGWAKTPNFNVVKPGVCVIILVNEPITDAKIKVNQCEIAGVVAEVKTAGIIDAVFLSANGKSVEMIVVPSECNL